MLVGKLLKGLRKFHGESRRVAIHQVPGKNIGMGRHERRMGSCLQESLARGEHPQSVNNLKRTIASRQM